MHSLNRPTFFTRDDDFYNYKLCHAGYSLVYLSVKKDEVAIFIRRLLRHKELNTITKRMGLVIRVSHSGLTIWRLHEKHQISFSWID